MKHMHINAIQRILKSRGIECQKAIGTIKRTSTCRWRVINLVKDGQPYPDQLFEVVDGRMTWRAA